MLWQSKYKKLRTIKTLLTPLIDRIVIANDDQYGGTRAANAHPGAAIGQMAAAIARNGGAGRGGNIEQEDWLTMGQGLYQKRLTAPLNSLNAVCDTLSAAVIYALNTMPITSSMKFELFKNPKPTKHHFVVVDRADGSDERNFQTWGSYCFVIDLWHAKRSPTASLRGCFCPVIDYHGQHGVYRYPSEHLYSRPDYGPQCEYTWHRAP